MLTLTIVLKLIAAAAALAFAFHMGKGSKSKIQTIAREEARTQIAIDRRLHLRPVGNSKVPLFEDMGRRIMRPMDFCMPTANGNAPDALTQIFAHERNQLLTNNQGGEQ